MLTSYAVTRYDPTRTTMLRNRFSREMDSRFSALIVAIRKAVVNEDVFGLSLLTQAKKVPTPGDKAFAYPSIKDQISAFMQWVDTQIEDGILGVAVGTQLSRAAEIAWTNYYVRLAYEQGIRRARQELINKRYQVPKLEDSGGVNGVIAHPSHNKNIGLLYERTFVELKGVTDTMHQQINRVLAQAMTEGKNAKQIARLLVRTIGGPTLELTDTLGRFIPAKRRAQLIARTELIRAHHLATIREYRNWGLSNVKVKAEWETMQDGRVCPECMSMDGKVFSLDEIEGKIPLHPGCRCFAEPLAA